MRMMYRPGGTFEFQGVMLDSQVVSDDQIEQYEKDGWGCAWSFVGIESDGNESNDNLPDGGQYERDLRDSIKALGGKPGGRSSVETLEKQLAELQSDYNNDGGGDGD